MLIFYVVGVSIIGVGIYLLIDSYLFYTQSKKLPAHIVGFEIGRSNQSSANVFTPIISYEDEGKVYRFKTSVSSSRVHYDVAEEVDVIVKNSAHSSARLKGSRRSLLALSLIFMGSFPFYFAITTLSKEKSYEMLFAVALFLLVVELIALLKFSHDYEKKREREFCYEPNEDGVIGYALSEDVITDVSILNRTKPTNKSYLVGAFFGTLFIFIALFWTNRLYNFKHNALHVEGTIVENKRFISNGEFITSPIIEFVTFTGEKVRVDSKAGESKPTFKIGDKLSILYKKEDVNYAIIDRGIYNYIVPIVLLILGLIINFVAFFGLKK